MRESFPFLSPTRFGLHLLWNRGNCVVHDCMDRMGREVLALRHFEQLTNAKAAQVLGLAESAASKRYVRALERLSQILCDAGGFPD